MTSAPWYHELYGGISQTASAVNAATMAGMSLSSRARA